MPRRTNPYGKLVDRENAHFVYQSLDGQWTYYVLRTYQLPEKEEKNPFARWLVNVVSPSTSPRGETGDSYISAVTSGTVKLDHNPLKTKEPDNIRHIEDYW
jgi:hypothetical protein